jgi:hypothetical protein
MCASTLSRLIPERSRRADPVDELGRRRLLAQVVLLAQPVELDQHLVEQRGVEMRMVDIDDPPHQGRIGEVDVVEDAAAQEGVGQFLLVVRGDEHDRALFRLHLFAGLGDGEAHLVELAQQVVRELEVGLVDLVDQQHVAIGGGERAAERSKLDVVVDVGDVAGAEAAVVEALHGVVHVQAIGRLRRGLDVPRQHRHREAVGDVTRQDGLAGARLALQQQRALERDRSS